MSTEPAGASSMAATSRKRFVAGLVLLLAVAAALRLAYPTADPPWRATVGIVWHDEGAWVHNARNKALFGEWQLDAWNPLFLAPVFTLLEYWSFALLGVGLWQARLVSQVTGLVSVLCLGLGVARIGGRRAGLIAAALLATNYVYVMYGRAALMEASMVAFMVLSWYALCRAVAQPVWGLAAAAAALLAFFTKAAAVGYVAALGLIAAWTLVERTWLAPRRAENLPGSRPLADRDTSARAAAFVLVGLAAAAAIALVAFVLPYWTEYRFYNWQMSVVRKPSYDVGALVDRASWFPIAHDFFSRMWLVLVASLIGLAGLALRWRTATMPERLLGLWIVLGVAELVLHDTGNERRFLLLIPPMAAIAALVLARSPRVFPPELERVSRWQLLLASPLLAWMLYVAWGPIARLPFLYEIRPAVHLSALLAVGTAGALYAFWPRVRAWLVRGPWPAAAPTIVVALAVGGDLAQFGQWAGGRTYKNHGASVALAGRLPPGTLVHGKLANGLSLENRIRPVFIGRGFGNYDDRMSRPDIRYMLTYTAPRLGYEGPVIVDVLQAHPGWQIVWSFDVAETTTGHDRAALIDKCPAAAAAPARSAAHGTGGCPGAGSAPVGDDGAGLNARAAGAGRANR